METAVLPLSVTPACPVCHGPRLYYLFSLGSDRVVRCEDCGLLVAQGHPADAVVAAGPAPTATDIARHCLSYGGPTSGQAWCYAAVTPEVQESLRQSGLTVVTAAQPPADAIGTFDITVLGDQLNYAADPAALLAKAHRALRLGGCLVTWTPSLSGWCGGALPGRTTSNAVAAGRFRFNRETLQSVLFRASFRRLAVYPLSGRPSVRHDDPGGIVLAQAAPQRQQPLLSVIVAIYNEAATAASALDQITAKRIPGLDIEFIIVESNSTDGTREIVQRYARRPDVTVVWEDRPRGKGRAVREGLSHATGDFVLIQDADLEYDLDDYDLLLEPLRAGRAAFVLGARHGGQTWKIRRFNDQPVQAMVLNLAHRAFTALINVSCGLSLSDPFTMYKVFRRDCLFGLTFECNRFDFDWEILIKFVRKGYVPLEIPVNYRSRSFKEGKKVRMIRDPLTWIRAWAQARFGPLQR